MQSLDTLYITLSLIVVVALHQDVTVIELRVRADDAFQIDT
jgi:hypothetical protein